LKRRFLVATARRLCAPLASDLLLVLALSWTNGTHTTARITYMSFHKLQLFPLFVICTKEYHQARNCCEIIKFPFFFEVGEECFPLSGPKNVGNFGKLLFPKKIDSSNKYQILIQVSYTKYLSGSTFPETGDHCKQLFAKIKTVSNFSPISEWPSQEGSNNKAERVRNQNNISIILKANLKTVSFCCIKPSYLNGNI